MSPREPELASALRDSHKPSLGIYFVEASILASSSDMGNSRCLLSMVLKSLEWNGRAALALIMPLSP